jgi:hypothetical protein
MVSAVELDLAVEAMLVEMSAGKQQCLIGTKHADSLARPICIRVAGLLPAAVADMFTASKPAQIWRHDLHMHQGVFAAAARIATLECRT